MLIVTKNKKQHTIPLTPPPPPPKKKKQTKKTKQNKKLNKKQKKTKKQTKQTNKQKKQTKKNKKKQQQQTIPAPMKHAKVTLTSDSMLLHVWQLNALHLQHVPIWKFSPVGHFKVKSGQSPLTKVTATATATITNLINMSDLQARSNARTARASHYISFFFTVSHFARKYIVGRESKSRHSDFYQNDFLSTHGAHSDSVKFLQL